MTIRGLATKRWINPWFNMCVIAHAAQESAFNRCMQVTARERRHDVIKKKIGFFVLLEKNVILAKLKRVQHQTGEEFSELLPRLNLISPGLNLFP